jgi:hypothetical protein
MKKGDARSSSPSPQSSPPRGEDIFFLYYLLRLAMVNLLIARSKAPIDE